MNEKFIITDYANFMGQEEITGKKIPQNNQDTSWQELMNW